MGFLQVLGLWATRLWQVSNPRSRDAVGIGAFNLIRTSAYQADSAAFDSLRMEILEDLTLARRVKAGPPPPALRLRPRLRPHPLGRREPPASSAA